MLVALYRRNWCYGVRMACDTKLEVVFWYTHVTAYERHYHVTLSDLSVRPSACLSLISAFTPMYFPSIKYSWQARIKRSHSVFILLMLIENKTNMPLFRPHVHKQYLRRPMKCKQLLHKSSPLLCTTHTSHVESSCCGLPAELTVPHSSFYSKSQNYLVTKFYSRSPAKCAYCRCLHYSDLLTTLLSTPRLIKCNDLYTWGSV